MGAASSSCSQCTVLGGPQVYTVDFASADTELARAGAPVVAPERFNRLSWGSLGLDTDAFPVPGPSWQ